MHAPKRFLALTLALPLAFAVSQAHATYTTCPDGSKVKPPATCPKPPPPTPAPDPIPGQTQSQQQQQQQDQHQTANGGDSASTGVGIGVGVGGSVGDTTATGGAGFGGAGGQGGAGGSVTGSGNSANLNANTANGGAGGAANLSDSGNSASLSGAISGSNATGGDVGDVGNNSGNATLGDVGSNSSVGDQTLSNGSHSGGNTMTGGANTASNAASADDSGNSNVVVDTSDRSVTNVEGTRINTFIPGDLPSNAMTIAPSASITVAGDQSCGVLVSKVQIPVYQWDKKGKNKVLVGYDEDVTPFLNSEGQQMDYEIISLPDGGYYLRGSHVTYVLSTQGNSTSTQLGLQGGGGGGYGGLSFGSGRSYSQAGARIIIRPCIADRVNQAMPSIQFNEPRTPRG